MVMAITTPTTETAPLSPRAGMDRKIERRPRRLLWAAVTVVSLTLVTSLTIAFVRASGVRTFAVERERVTISNVSSGTFHDFIPIRGNVAPLDVVYLDAIEGGRVEKILAEEGAFLEKGQPVLELSNTALQLDVISREAEVTEQLNNLRNTRLAIEQNKLTLKSTLVEMDYQIARLGRLAQRRGELAERGLIARQDYEDTADELAYYRNRREVTLQAQEQDDRMRLAQIASLETGVEQLQKNLAIARGNLDSLVIKAPIAGQLTSLDVEVGEAKKPAERLGQIDDVDDYKITAAIDEFYVTRVQRGQTAEATIDGTAYALTIAKQYPQIENGQFQVDLEFSGAAPTNIRRGQTLQMRLALGDSATALLLPRGPFFDDTGGNWVFALDSSGSYAEKRAVRLGRKNPDSVEVLEGLAEGERAITSEYASFTAMDRIAFKN
jgi:HlyD family secretion protein